MTPSPNPDSRPRAPLQLTTKGWDELDEARKSILGLSRLFQREKLASHGVEHDRATPPAQNLAPPPSQDVAPLAQDVAPPPAQDVATPAQDVAPPDAMNGFSHPPWLQNGFYLAPWLQMVCRTTVDVANTYAEALAADGYDSLEALALLDEPPSLIQPAHIDLLRPFLAQPPRSDKRLREELEETLRCPITQEPFKEPVMAPDGFIYERDAITTWLQRKSTSPMTNLPMKKRLVTSKMLQNIAHAVHADDP